ncbi:hypothetical protein FPQ18DRAFT_40148 [Pyronema domesticum]|nr:hypothetical protein FPQ18DRAFT_40148 [Pyronema domesticum]
MEKRDKVWFCTDEVDALTRRRLLLAVTSFAVALVPVLGGAVWLACKSVRVKLVSLAFPYTSYSSAARAFFQFAILLHSTTFSLAALPSSTNLLPSTTQLLCFLDTQTILAFSPLPSPNTHPTNSFESWYVCRSIKLSIYIRFSLPLSSLPLHSTTSYLRPST